LFGYVKSEGASVSHFAAGTSAFALREDREDLALWWLACINMAELCHFAVV
jgi:hypothetical protein